MGDKLIGGQDADTLRTGIGQATKSGRTRTPPLRVSEVSAVRTGDMTVADTSSARAFLKTLRSDATAALEGRLVVSRSTGRNRRPDAQAEAEARVADLFNATAAAAATYLNAGTPNAATRQMLRDVASVTGALAGYRPIDSNNCVEAP